MLTINQQIVKKIAAFAVILILLSPSIAEAQRMGRRGGGAVDVLWVVDLSQLCLGPRVIEL